MLYRKGYKYVVHEMTQIATGIYGHEIDKDLFYLEKNGLLTVDAGYAWDGATFAADTDNFMVPSLVHDIFYQCMAEGWLSIELKKTVDELLIKMCADRGMWGIRQWWVYRGVRLNPQPDKKKVYEVE